MIDQAYRNGRYSRTSITLRPRTRRSKTTTPNGSMRFFMELVENRFASTAKSRRLRSPFNKGPSLRYCCLVPLHRRIPAFRTEYE
jgi:hypothetical protein